MALRPCSVTYWKLCWPCAATDAQREQLQALPALQPSCGLIPNGCGLVGAAFAGLSSAAGATSTGAASSAEGASASAGASSTAGAASAGFSSEAGAISVGAASSAMGP
eukprot:16436492-Heterocapsa_arctica.AAC.1